MTNLIFLVLFGLLFVIQQLFVKQKLSNDLHNAQFEHKIALAPGVFSDDFISNILKTEMETHLSHLSHMTSYDFLKKSQVQDVNRHVHKSIPARQSHEGHPFVQLLHALPMPV